MFMLLFCKYHINPTTHNYNKSACGKLEYMPSNNNSVTTGQARIKGHLSGQFLKIYIKRLIFVISIHNTSIK